MKAKKRFWTRREETELYQLAEHCSMKETATRLGRSIGSIDQKARLLGISWRRAGVSLNDIAKEVGCSETTVKRMATILLWEDSLGKTGEGTGSRYRLTDEQADRVRGALLRTRKLRKQQIQAGRLGAAAKVAHANLRT
jgi:DNA-binding CsgD family transcriptional regulator